MSHRGGICRLFDRRDQNNPSPNLDISTPSTDSGNLVWAFDPNGSNFTTQAVVGPVPTSVSNSGVPLKKVTGFGINPSYYDNNWFGSNFHGGYLDFGDSLDNVWTAGVFTVHAAISISALDITLNSNLLIINKALSGNFPTEFFIGTSMLNGSGGNLYLQANYNGAVTAGQFDDWIDQLQSLHVGRHVISASFNIGNARSSRGKIYVDGVQLTTISYNTAGVDGTIADTTRTLRTLGDQNADGPGVSTMGVIYAYNIEQSAANIAAVSNFIINTKKWV